MLKILRRQERCDERGPNFVWKGENSGARRRGGRQKMREVPKMATGEVNGGNKRIRRQSGESL
jgi:hypothetical protein